jgi:flagellin-like hook-associated protein FlgL
MLGTAQNTYANMREQGKCICDLINKAHEEGRSKEEIDSINAEIASRVDDIENFYKGAMFNGVNPLEQPFGITLPRELMGNEDEKEITELLTSVDFNFDMAVNVDGKIMNIGAQATINIGYNEDGALQITVDASMDYDLSGIVENGAESENALDIITRFLSLIDGKQNELDFASNFLDKIFEKASTSLDNFKYLFPEVSGADESTSLQGKITQHASITLDGANQMPNIAINIL